MLKNKSKYSKEKILNKILINTLKLSKRSKFTNKKLTQFLYGTRNDINIFRVSELQYFLLSFYPLIKSLFNNSQFNYIYLKKWTKKLQPKAFSFNRRNKETSSYEWYWKVNKYIHFLPRKPNIQILFVTATKKYETIIRSAARLCHMPFHTGRWKTGSMTARAFYIKDPTTWGFLSTAKTEALPRYFRKKYSVGQSATNFLQSQKFFWRDYKQPSLIIIPDITSNYSVIRESKKLGIPTIGIINSDENIIIDYPFFSNSSTIKVIYFFCHFLANLISKQLNNRQDPDFNITLRNSFALSHPTKNSTKINPLKGSRHMTKKKKLLPKKQRVQKASSSIKDLKKKNIKKAKIVSYEIQRKTKSKH